MFPEFQLKWLVQAHGNLTFNSVLQQIKDGLITIDRTYVFFQLGGNQVLSANNDNFFQQILNLVVAVRERRNDSRIYFLGILPKPIDNENVKPFICRANRWMSVAVDRINKMFSRIKFLPIQLKFLNGNLPRKELFNQDGITLNPAGAQVFKTQVFQLAGFVKNN